MTPAKIIKTYACVFCERPFSRKSWYDKHDCAKKRRFAEANNLTTIKAMQLFQYWHRAHNLKMKTKDTPMNEFLNSPFYGTFKKLAEFTQKTYVISAFKYLDWLIQNKIGEKLWSSPKNLDSFREYIRGQETVPDQVQISFRNIRAWCVENNVTEVGEFFSRIGPLDALMMVRQNKLLPWVLFGYTGSVDHLVTRLSPEQMFALDEFINLEYWLSMLDEHPDKRALAQSLSLEAVRASS